MKNKIIATVLSLILIFSSAVMLASAEAFRLGDVNGDDKVNAMDARMALRAASKIETLEADAFKAADVNFDNRITAMDARTILRASAKIEDLPEVPTEEISETETTTAETTTAETTTAETTTAETTTAETTTAEPDTGVVVDEYPEAIRAFLDGEFYLDGSIVSGDSATEVKMATGSKGTEIVMNTGNVEMSMLSLRGKSYLKIISPDGAKYYVELTEALMEQFGIDFSDILSEVNFSELFEDAQDPVLTTGEFDGQECDIYTFSGTSDVGNAVAFYAVGDEVVKFALIEDGEEVTSIVVNELVGSDDMPGDMLSVKNFKETSIFALATILEGAFQ